jgi:hypothetical protein
MRRTLLIALVLCAPLVAAGTALAAPTITATWEHSSVIRPSGEVVGTCEIFGSFTGFPANSTITIVASSVAYGEVLRLAVPFGAGGSFGGILVFEEDAVSGPPGDLSVTTFIDSNDNGFQDPSEPTLGATTLRGLCEPATREECRNSRFRDFVLIDFKSQGACISHVATRGKEG